MGNTIGPGSSFDVETLIIGGGPTGLGAAYSLEKNDWVLVDADKQPGGLAGSFRTPEGFRFDHGYTVIPRRYDFIEHVLAELGPKYDAEGKLVKNREFIEFIEKVRTNWVSLRGHFVKFPIQSNLAGLPAKEQTFLPKTRRITSTTGSLNSGGETLTNLFFRPMMFKTWAHPTTKLAHNWVKSKIPPTDLKRDLVRTLDGEQKDDLWGHSSSFKYPKRNGLGGVWKMLAKKLPRNNVKFRAEVVQIDLEEKVAKTRDDIEIKYKNLISTMPLSTLLDLTGRSDAADRLLHSSLHLVCLGLRGKPEDLFGKNGCIYYPEVGTIFHKACVFSNVDPDSVPDKTTELITLRRADQEIQSSDDESYKPGPYWSLMLEISEGPLKEVSNATLVEQVIIDCLGVGLLKPDDEIVSMHVTQMTHGFPVPTIDRDEIVNEQLEWLKSHNVWSRGRFGAFKYEVGNADHCFIQGVEAVDNIEFGTSEKTAFNPSEVNKVGQMNEYPIHDVELLKQELKQKPDPEPPVDPIEPPDTDSEDIQMGIKSDSVSEIAASESESAVLVSRAESERDDDTVSNVTEEATD
ncbi:unnamed protein product [Oikopleura dioica]|uniref:Amine oxidase domain-containing protein n=1 Tax=Oikopleura dioica TaxID=34765 RepID=E4XFK8_OIKDI|nr:unnamed protein product [Oikopleura dioica]